jgi:hypothetical protein
VTARWTLLAAVVLAARLAHTGLLWVEEAYPAAAAIQLLHGAQIYRDFVFDKPPLSAYLYLLWAAHDGLPLRIAGASYVLLCCWLMARVATAIWSEREGRIGAALMAFYLTFDWPGAVMPMAPDLLMVAPHLAAVWLAGRNRPWAAGAMAGLSALIHTKGVFVLAACLIWVPASWWRLALSFTAVSSIQAGWLAATGSLTDYWEQVWAWGARYAADSFVANPIGEGIRRTVNWAGFHATIVVAAGTAVWKERQLTSLRLLLWAMLAFAGVCGGWRFFPRYYFLLLPVMVLAASRGLALLPRRQAIAIAALLLVPLGRFGPRYATLAVGGDADWTDTAMNRDTRQVAQWLAANARGADGLVVWGYRPDLYVYTRMRAASRFLDSQPLTGVIADRHLFHSTATFPELARANRAELARERPDFVVDGLGPYNPNLAITRFDDLRQWLRGYEEVFRTTGSVVYRRRQSR